MDDSIHFVLYTEDIPKTDSLVQTALGDMPFTLVKGQGIWSGIRENSLAIHVIVDYPVKPAIVLALKVLVKLIKVTNKQEAILVESWRVKAKLF